MKKVYLDHSATTPIREEVLQTMVPYLSNVYGNASSVHTWGQEARIAVEEARESIANLIGATSSEIYFTSGGTEADNIALFGTVRAKEKKGKHIITSVIEHHAVLDAAHELETRGYDVTYIPVDKEGIISVDDVASAIREDTVLISIMLANNEIGTIQPIKEISKLTKDKGIILHTDAVQAAGSMKLDVNDLGVDMMTISAHKFYGPKGVGALYVRKGPRPKPLFYGGMQEKKIRPGTESVANIVGMQKALELAVSEMEETNERIKYLRNKLINEVEKNISEVVLNGHREKRLANNANISFLYIEGEALILSLDAKGVAVSSGSACTSGSLDPSHVLMSMGMDHQQAHGSLRMTLGRSTTEEDIDYVLEVLPEIVDRLRAMSPIYNKRKES
ncbi:MAG: cysteine desulfurase NifS [Clostridia bacterium]